MIDYILGGIVAIGVILLTANEIKHRHIRANSKALAEEGINPTNPTATPYKGANQDFKS